MTLLTLLAASSAGAEQPLIDRCSRYLAQGQVSLASGDPKQAIAQFRKGIELAGQSYLAPGVLDDTGMRLTMAEILERKEQYQESANLYRSVLANRISIWNAKQPSRSADSK